MTTNYAFTEFDQHTAKASGRNLPISTKASINICNAVRGMSVDKALRYLVAVQEKTRAIPYTRFTDGVGHRPGNMAAGRYPVKAAQAIHDVIKSAQSNAAAQNLDETLSIVHICAHRGSQSMHQGRQRRRVMKRTHIEVVVREVQA